MNTTFCSRLVLACAVTSSLAVETVSRADTSNETFTGTAKTIVDWSGAISNFYGVGQAAVALAQALGVIQTSNPLGDLQALHQQIDQAASALSWYMAQSERETRLTNLQSAVNVTYDALNRGQSVDWYNLDLNTAQNVDAATKPTAFLRYYVDSDTNGPKNHGLFSWKDVISYTQADLLYDNGYVYDWRLGVPSFMQLIALRMQLMAMESPNFSQNKAFQTELMGYHDALVNQLSTMNGGIRCNFFDANNGTDQGCCDYWFACADIFSGLNETQEINTGAPVDQATLQSISDQMLHDVRTKTPFFGVQALIDTLYIYANGLSDITHLDPFIRAGVNASLCLDAPGSAGGQAQLYYCQGLVGPLSQSWRYDREQQTIAEVSSGLCLDAQSSTVGTPAVVNGCNGSVAQRWSFDAKYSLFNNWYGNVLDIQWGNLQSGTPVWTWWWNNGDAQHWTQQASNTFANAQLVTGGKCLDLPDSMTMNGTSLMIWDCNGATNQRWSLGADGLIRSAVDTNKCIDLPNWQSADGTWLQIWDCNGATNQQWTHNSDNSITGYLGSCVDLFGANTTNATGIDYYHCAGQWNQQWSAQ
jgi:hypothetical protein